MTRTIGAMVGTVALFAAVSVRPLPVSAEERLSRGWQCLPGIKTPVLVRGGDVACAATNGRDCMWGSCPGTNAAPEPWTPPSPMQPLVCGADHKSKYGVDGYSDPAHWCAQACAATGRCGAKWKCYPGIKAPVRFTAGNIECAATNGRDCLWDACSGENATKVDWHPSAPMQPLACGADHMSKYGVDGYSDPGHWCAQGCAQKQSCGNIWKCVPGVKSPVRVSGGDVQCAAKNGKDCLWDACPGTNTTPTAWTAPPDLAPLSCGADHLAKYGVDGYSKADHWCRLACDAFGCGK